MKLLVTNDDGYMARGIGLLSRAAARLGRVQVVAPDREQSATSHSLTMHFPLRVRRAANDMITVDGTPTDCVVLALGALLEERPDFVLSGVNHGANLGVVVLTPGRAPAPWGVLSLGFPPSAPLTPGRILASSGAGEDPSAIA